LGGALLMGILIEERALIVYILSTWSCSSSRNRLFSRAIYLTGM